jgi:hypothetical protein
MKKPFVLAAAFALFSASGAFVQPAMAQGQATGSDTRPGAANAQTDTASAPDAKQRKARKTTKSSQASNASEIETTRQLNEEQARLASAGGGAASSDAQSNSMNANSARRNSSTSGLGKIGGANSGVEGRVGGTNPGDPAP